MASVERFTGDTADPTHTIPAGVNCLAVVVSYGWYPPNGYNPPTAIVWDGAGANESLTFVGFAGRNGWSCTELWVLWNPTPGSNKNLDLQWGNGVASQITIGVFNLSDVDQTATGTPAQQSNTGNGGASGNKTTTHSGTTVNDIIIGGWSDDQGPGSTLTVLNSPVAGQEWEDIGADSDYAAHAWQGQAGSTTVGYNITDTANGDWNHGSWLFKGYSADTPPHAKDFSRFIPVYHRAHFTR